MKYIVVHAGRRDDYQVALALAEENVLKFLVTDFYAPYDSILIGNLIKILPKSIQSKFLKRYKPGLSSTLVFISYRSIFYEILYILTRNIKYSTRKDKALGNAAKKLSVKHGIPVLSMNTYAKYAFEGNKIHPKVLFQFHPHTAFVKKILTEEMEINPISRKSLLQEYEFSVSDEILEHLSTEIHLADHIICASGVTAKSLLNERVSKDHIKVIPYGVDTSFYPYKKREIRENGSVFKVVFIGSLNQRKGITYLLEALDGLPNIELHIIGRGIFDMDLISKYRVKVSIHKNIPHDEMISILQNSHCFVLPSLVEGFGQVILEAMATGIPVIASENTIAADIIIDGENGFLIPIRNHAAIREKIQMLINHPEMVQKIGDAGFQTSEKLNWKTFRAQIITDLKSLYYKK